MSNFAKFPKLWGDFARVYLENGKSYKKVSQDANTPGPPTITGAKLRYAVQLKADAGARAPGSVPSTPKISFLWSILNNPFSGKFQNYVTKDFMTTPIHIVLSLIHI